MRVAWVRPDGGATRAMIVISHGLWDSPESFMGWARYLASHGHAVLLPPHQGSDKRQQSAMVAGVVSPPSAAELHRRHLDVSALLDGLEEQTKGGLGPVDLRKVGVVGPSWGGITALQLGGAAPGTEAAEVALWGSTGSGAQPQLGAAAQPAAGGDGSGFRHQPWGDGEIPLHDVTHQLADGP
jgi:dienelactone hydrolase